jgi:hypothetical protein
MEHCSSSTESLYKVYFQAVTLFVSMLLLDKVLLLIEHLLYFHLDPLSSSIL